MSTRRSLALIEAPSLRSANEAASYPHVGAVLVIRFRAALKNSAQNSVAWSY
jgi:hypothetical protein